jgi:hypothetical protein
MPTTLEDRERAAVAIEGSLLRNQTVRFLAAQPRLTIPEVDEAALRLGLSRAHLYRLLARFRQRPRSSSGPWELLCHLQRDIVTALRGSPPSSFWLGTIPASQFLKVVDDLYWLLRKPGLSVIADPSSTFSDAFSWTNSLSSSRLLFHRTGHSAFSARHPDPKAELLLAIAATMLAERAFRVLKRLPYYPPLSRCYPFCWILRSLHTTHALRLRRMQATWPSTLQSRLRMAGQHRSATCSSTRSFAQLTPNILLFKGTHSPFKSPGWRCSPQ